MCMNMKGKEKTLIKDKDYTSDISCSFTYRDQNKIEIKNYASSNGKYRNVDHA